jgi:hypothetical protein
VCSGARQDLILCTHWHRCCCARDNLEIHIAADLVYRFEESSSEEPSLLEPSVLPASDSPASDRSAASPSAAFSGWRAG